MPLFSPFPLSCCKLFPPFFFCHFLFSSLAHVKKVLTCLPKGSSEPGVPHNQTCVSGCLNIPPCHRLQEWLLFYNRKRLLLFKHLSHFLNENMPRNQIPWISCLSVPECIRISALLLFGIPLSWKTASDHCKKYGALSFHGQSLTVTNL